MKSLKEIAQKSKVPLEDLVWIEEFILNTGYMGPEKVRQELEWFMVDLGIDPYYFKTTQTAEIAQNLISLSASEMITLQGGSGVATQLINEQEDKAVYIIEDNYEKTSEMEDRLESRYPDFRLESYRTAKLARGTQLRFYILNRPRFGTAGSTEGKKLKNGSAKNGGNPKSQTSTTQTFENAACEALLSRAVPETVARYKKAWESMNESETPFIAVSDKVETNETRIMVGVHGKDSRKVLCIFSQLVEKYGLEIRRKYRESFSDGKRINSFYLPLMKEKLREDLTRDLNVTMMLPNNPISTLFFSGPFNPEKAMYAVSAAAFTHQFLSMLTDDYRILQRALKDQPEARGIVDNLKLHLIKDTYSTARIAQTVLNAPDIVATLYDDFVARARGAENAGALEKREATIKQILERDVARSKDREILHYFLIFNKAILLTNFFKRDKSCAAFRLDPKILDRDDFNEQPLACFSLWEGNSWASTYASAISHGAESA